MKALFSLITVVYSVFAISTAAFAESRPVATPLYSDQGTTLITQLPAGTELTVIDTVGSYLIVKIIGYIPIKTTTTSASTITKPSQQSSEYSGQCTATTKKGTRCKRSAKAGSTRCWQHQ